MDKRQTNPPSFPPLTGRFLVIKKSPVYLRYTRFKGKMGLLAFLRVFFTFENIEEHDEWECEKFSDIGFYPKKCWIFFEYHFEEIRKFVRLFVTIEGENEKISDKLKQTNCELQIKNCKLFVEM